VSCAKPKFITLEQYAAERRIRAGYMLYIRKEPGFPRPVLRHGRESFYDRDDIARFWKETRPHFRIAKC
jgi:hypothetical protein